MDIYCIIWVCTADVCYQKRMAHLCLWNISLFYAWLVKVNAPHAGTQLMGTVVKTCYEWLIWGGTSGNSWYTAALWHTERDCMGDGCLVAERVYDCCIEALWEEQHPPHPAPPLWIIHLLSLSLWPPRRALISSRLPFLPPALLFSFSTSHSLCLCHKLCTPLALLPWQPWVKSQHVEKQRWGFWLCVSGKERWGLLHYCVWGSMRVFFWSCRCKVAGWFYCFTVYCSMIISYYLSFFSRSLLWRDRCSTF